MKSFRFRFFLCMAAMLFVASACSLGPVIEFRGIPIKGDLEPFVQKMSEIGYAKRSVDSDKAWMSGSFLDLDCDVMILCHNKKNVSSVSVFCPVGGYCLPGREWTRIGNAIESYLAMSKKLTESLGTPSEQEMDFCAGFKDDGVPVVPGDKEMAKAFIDGKAALNRTWYKDNGGITISFDYIKKLAGETVNGFYVEVAYWNGDNVKKIYRKSGGGASTPEI